MQSVDTNVVSYEIEKTDRYVILNTIYGDHQIKAAIPIELANKLSNALMFSRTLDLSIPCQQNVFAGPNSENIIINVFNNNQHDVHTNISFVVQCGIFAINSMLTPESAMELGKSIHHSGTGRGRVDGLALVSSAEFNQSPQLR